MNMSVVSLSIEDELAIVTINKPPVNATSHDVRAGLVEVLSQTNDDPSFQAVLLTCAGATFVAGADINEFSEPPKAPTLPNVISEIENARIPWLAVVHGTALGGGLELALGCRYRIADKNAFFGLPEIKLGLIPGAGGTVRLPRLVAMQDALNIITSGNSIDAIKAKDIGLVDEVVGTDLLVASKSFARKHVINTDRLPLSQLPILMPLSSAVLDKAITVAKRRNEFAKVAALDTMAKGLDASTQDAILLAQTTFQTLRDSDQSKALRHLFFAERSVSKIAALKGVEARPIDEVGVVGGGTMGVGIASSALLNGLKVVLIERDDAAAKLAQDKIRKTLEASLIRGVISSEKHALAVDNIAASTKYDALSSADIVVEAVFEDMQVKKDVFTRLDEVTKPSAVLASNTSYLDIEAIATHTKDPSRVVGLHYFSPAHIMKLLEVVRTDIVAPEVFATALLFAKRTRKIAVPTGNGQGFIGNRIMSAYRKTCEYLLEDGALPHEVDRAMKNYGFPMGIFEMQDLAGLDIGWAMRKQLTSSQKSKMRYVDIADRICEANRFGRKTGSGYYKYDDGKTAQNDEWVEQLIESESVRKGIVRRSFTEAEILATILQSLKKEADKVLVEGIADSSNAIDVVMVNGFGFPRWRGGPMFAE